MPTLCDSGIRAKFLNMLQHCERLPTHTLNDWEVDFIRDLRSRFDKRDDDVDFGLTPWSPSVRQWNSLHEIYHRTLQ